MPARNHVSLAFVLLVAVTASQARAQDPSRYPLMVIEQNRASVVKAIVDRWAHAFAVLPSGEQRGRAELADELWALRSDRLLAASLAGSVVTVADALSQSRDEGADGVAKPATKALGDTSDDLTYTPLTPCRIVDTRFAGGALMATVTRTFDGYAATSFSAQGGAASGCGIPNGAAALAVTATAVQPGAAGFITLWQANVARPLTSSVNYSAGAFATATGAVVPVDSTSNNRFAAWSPAGVDLVVDVVGYFRSPAATALDCYITTTTTASIPAGGQANVASPSCAAGFTVVSGNCLAFSGSLIWSSRFGSGWQCTSNAPATLSSSISVNANCCRVPGR